MLESNLEGKNIDPQYLTLYSIYHHITIFTLDKQETLTRKELQIQDCLLHLMLVESAY